MQLDQTARSATPQVCGFLRKPSQIQRHVSYPSTKLKCEAKTKGTSTSHTANEVENNAQNRPLKIKIVVGVPPSAKLPLIPITAAEQGCTETGSNKGVLCTAKKKGGGSARFHHSARCASKWRRPNLREAGRTAGNPTCMPCYAGERLGVAFCVF